MEIKGLIKHNLIYLFVASVTVLFFAELVKILFSPNIIKGDDLNFTYPAFIFMKSNFLTNGYFPKWNPFIHSGSVFWGEYAFSYPSNLPFIFLNASAAIKLQYLLFPIFAAVSMFALARFYSLGITASLSCAFTFVLSGFFALQIKAGYLGFLSGIAFTPLSMLFFEKLLSEKKKIIWIGVSGLIFGLQMLLLGPYFISLVFPLIFLRILFEFFQLLRAKRFNEAKKILGYCILIGVISLCIVAPKIIPMVYYSKFSSRLGNLGLLAATKGSVHPASILNLFIPGLFNEKGVNSFVGASSILNFGSVAFFLALLSLFRDRLMSKFYLVLGGICLLFSMGRYSPLYLFCYYFIPPFSTIRHPRLFLFPFIFSLSLLTGFGFNDYTSIFKRVYSYKKAWLIICGILVIFIIGVLSMPVEKKITDIFFSSSTKFSLEALFKILSLPHVFSVSKLPKEAIALLMNNIKIDLKVFVSVLLTILSWITLRSRSKPSRIQKPFNVYLVGFLLFDFFLLHYPKCFSVEDPNIYFDNNRLIRIMKTDNSLFRVFPIGPDAFRHNEGMVYGIQSIKGASAFMYKRYAKFLNLLDGQVDNDILPFPELYERISNYDSPLTSLLNVKYIISDYEITSPKLKFIAADKHLYLYENNNFQPRAFFANKAKVFNDEITLCKQLVSLQADLRNSVFLEEELPNGFQALAQNGRSELSEGYNVYIRKYESGYINLEVESPKNTFLVISEISLPGWKAYLDRRLTKIYRANYILMALPIMEGRHEVKLVFDPPFVSFSFILSLIALIFVIANIVIYFRQKKI